MRAMILAAGRGERMLPLTRDKPKPLLTVNGKPLICHQVEKLVHAGIQQIVINHARLGEQIEACLRDGRHLGARITYSPEGDEPLETGGGILRALPLLGNEPFITLNADIWTDYPLQNLPVAPEGLAYLVLVDNPAHHQAGDFCLQGKQVLNAGEPRYTFSGIGVYRPEMFAACTPGAFPLGPLLQRAAAENQVQGEYYAGSWSDIGTPDRLAAIQGTK